MKTQNQNTTPNNKWCIAAKRSEASNDTVG